jgi:hypothetical protein
VEDRRTRVIRAVFDSPADPDRFSRKERCHFAVVVLFPLEVKRQLKTLRAAQARALEIARQMIQDRIYTRLLFRFDARTASVLNPQPIVISFVAIHLYYLG